MCSYGMLSAIDGKTKLMYLVYGDEVFRRSGFPEYMSATALDENGAPRQLQEPNNGQHPEEYAGAKRVRRMRGRRFCGTPTLAIFWNVSK